MILYIALYSSSMLFICPKSMCSRDLQQRPALLQRLRQDLEAVGGGGGDVAGGLGLPLPGAFAELQQHAAGDGGCAASKEGREW